MKHFILQGIFLLSFCGMSSGQRVQKVNVVQLETIINQSKHPLLVDFWATYCVPCMEEIPTMEKKVKEHPGVKLLLVSLDLPNYYPARVEQFAQEHRLAGSLYWLNETNADYFCPRIDTNWSGGIPASLFINPRTHYRRFLEKQLNAGELNDNLERLLRN